MVRWRRRITFMTNAILHKIASLKDLKKFAALFAKDLKPGDVVALGGELGAGKTTLVQMAARALGVKARVASPTFVIFKIYDATKNKQGIKRLCHADLYRINTAESAIGFEECFADSGAVCFIEWAEKMKKKLPKGAIWVKMGIASNGDRVIKVLK